MDRDAQLQEVRKRMMAKKSGRQRDPMEFRPPTVQAGQPELKYKFIVLPPLKQGETCATGKASKTMDLWYIPAGTHWINNKPYECPRVHDGLDCDYCTLGFDLLKTTDEDDPARKDIIKVYMPRTASTINIYFPPYQSNPEEVRGKVMWYAAQKTVFDVMAKTLMRDASKDDQDPQAFGFFYLPDESYVFQLAINHKGGFNDYTSSKFLPNTKGPMVKKSDGSLDQEAVNALLAQRHDLFTKYAERDAATLSKLAKAVLNGAPDREEVAAEEAKAASKPAPKSESKPAPKADDDELLPATSSKPVSESTKKTAEATKPAAAAKPAASKPAAPISDDDPDLQALLNDIQS